MWWGNPVIGDALLLVGSLRVLISSSSSWLRRSNVGGQANRSKRRPDSIAPAHGHSTINTSKENQHSWSTTAAWGKQNHHPLWLLCAADSLSRNTMLLLLLLLFRIDRYCDFGRGFKQTPARAEFAPWLVYRVRVLDQLISILVGSFQQLPTVCDWSQNYFWNWKIQRDRGKLCRQYVNGIA